MIVSMTRKFGRVNRVWEIFSKKIPGKGFETQNAKRKTQRAKCKVQSIERSFVNFVLSL